MMTDDDDEDMPPPRRPVSGLVWAALGVLVVLAFIVALRVMNPPGIGP